MQVQNVDPPKASALAAASAVAFPIETASEELIYESHLQTATCLGERMASKRLFMSMWYEIGIPVEVRRLRSLQRVPKS